jgi:hypothetical protein
MVSSEWLTSPATISEVPIGCSGMALTHDMFNFRRKEKKVQEEGFKKKSSRRSVSRRN